MRNKRETVKLQRIDRTFGNKKNDRSAQQLKEEMNLQ